MMGARARGWVVVALAVAGLLVAPTSFANPRDDAVKLADQAFDQMEKGEFGKAADLFEEAAKLYYSPVIALYWARAKAKQGKLVEARAIVNTIEDKPLPDGAKPSWTKAVDEATIFGVELDGRIPTVTVTVDGAPGARVSLDDEPIEAGHSVKVNPGKHAVVVTNKDGEKKVEGFTLREKESHSVAVSFNTNVDNSTTSPSLVGPIIAYSVAGVGLVIGVVTGIIFVGKADELDETCPDDVCPVGQSELLDDTTTLGNVSTVAWVIAGLGAAAGTVLLFVPLGEGEDPVITVEATPVSGSVRVRF
jgi:hypothetical protein